MPCTELKTTSLPFCYTTDGRPEDSLTCWGISGESGTFLMRVPTAGGASLLLSFLPKTVWKWKQIGLSGVCVSAPSGMLTRLFGKLEHRLDCTWFMKPCLVLKWSNLILQHDLQHSYRKGWLVLYFFIKEKPLRSYSGSVKFICNLQ